jgi:hypothetical protein
MQISKDHSWPLRRRRWSSKYASKSGISRSSVLNAIDNSPIENLKEDKKKNEKECNTTKKRYDSVPNFSFILSLSNYIYMHLAKIVQPPDSPNYTLYHPRRACADFQDPYSFQPTSTQTTPRNHHFEEHRGLEGEAGFGDECEGVGGVEGKGCSTRGGG